MQTRQPTILKYLILTAAQRQKKHSMLSTRYDNATLHLRNWQLVRRKSFITISTSGKNWARRKVHYNINADHSSLDHTIAGINSDLVISPEQCRSLVKGKMIYLVDQFLGVGYGKMNPIEITDSSMSATIRNRCKSRVWINRDTFFPHMQRTTLEVRMCTGKVLSDSAQVLPCASEELGCDTTSLDPYAYIWDYPDNCVLSVRGRKILTWWNKEQNFIISVDPIEQPNLYSKLKTTLKNIVKIRQIFTQLVRIHYT